MESQDLKTRSTRFQYRWSFFWRQGFCKSSGVDAEIVDKHGEGKNNLLTLIRKNEINLIINTPSGKKSQSDMRSIRADAILHNVPCITTLQAAWAAVNGIEAILAKQMSVKSLQSYYAANKKNNSCDVR